ncbi:MAG: chemotaxis protein CheD [Syntrophobacteraceae bacterium]
MKTPLRTREVKHVSIHIGEYHASKKPAVIGTLLGSCIAVCLIDPVESIGGMNHILLPGKAGIGCYDDVSRYAVNSMELLINNIMRLGGKRNLLQAKVFGGANVVPCISEENGMGRKNAEFVLQFLELEGIPVLSHDLGGVNARRIYFRTDTGEVLLRRIPSARQQAVRAGELEMQERLRKEVDKAGEITLFT